MVRETELIKDLEITGVDADEFMNSFFKTFGVQIGDFDFCEYFEGEGFLSFFAFKNKKTKPITLEMLEKAARKGVWKSSEARANDRHM